jgi:hypothetical protein
MNVLQLVAIVAIVAIGAAALVAWRVAMTWRGRAAQLAAQLAEAQKPAPYTIPGPYDLAVAFGQAAVAGGRFENIEAAMESAWCAIPAFWAGRDRYVREIAPALVFGQAMAAPAPVFAQTGMMQAPTAAPSLSPAEGGPAIAPST